MKVKDITELMGNEVHILLECDTTEKFTVYDGKIIGLHGKYLNAEVEWIRPMQNGVALRVNL